MFVSEGLSRTYGQVTDTPWEGMASRLIPPWSAEDCTPTSTVSNTSACL